LCAFNRCLRKLTGTAVLPRPAASPAEASALASNNQLVVVSHGLPSDSPDGPVFNYATQVVLAWKGEGKYRHITMLLQGARCSNRS
jgi:hypothetical protein